MIIVSSSLNYELHHDQASGLAMMKFIGDFSDAHYKELWNLAIDLGVAHKVTKVIIHQKEIGDVSFKARAWAVMYAFPRVKRELTNNLAACIISSNRTMQKAGMQYLLKAFIGFTGYKVELCATVDEAISFLNSQN